MATDYPPLTSCYTVCWCRWSVAPCAAWAGTGTDPTSAPPTPDTQYHKPGARTLSTHYLHTIYTHYIYTLSKHYLRTIYSLAPVPATNTADLVRSSLSFTLAQWPLGRLDQDIDNRHTGQPGQGNIGNVHNMGKIISYRNGFNRTKVCANWAVAGHVWCSEFSCQSTSTCSEGEEDTSCQGVTSSTILRLEFPPRSHSTYLQFTYLQSTYLHIYSTAGAWLCRPPCWW